MIFLCPCQPTVLPNSFTIQKLKDRRLKFLTSWYKEFKWLHVIQGSDGMNCISCYRYVSACPDKNLATKMDSLFSGKGFKNWKKAIETFKIHDKSASHAQYSVEVPYRATVIISESNSPKGSMGKFANDRKFNKVFS